MTKVSLGSVARAVVRLPGRALLLLIRGYQWTLGPLLGRVCRFEPSCSRYMIGALEKYGPARGLIRGLGRIARCHPWNPGGYDPP